MKIVVIGASGRTGGALVPALRRDGFTVVEASRFYGVDTVTGEGLDHALRDAAVVVDVSDAPAKDGPAAQRFFEASGRRLLAAARAAGVRHHIALSIVGTDRLLESGYFRGKQIQEDLIRDSGIPYSILRSTQFFDFIARVVQDWEDETEEVAISSALAQPVAAIEVAEALAAMAAGEPSNRTVELAGPERFRLCDVATEVLTAYEDPRRIVPDPRAPYFGAVLTDRSLLPGEGARLGALRFEDWLRQTLEVTPRPSPYARPQPGARDRPFAGPPPAAEFP